MESRQRTPTVASHGPTRRRPGTRPVVFRVIALALLAVALLSTAVEAGPAGRSLSPSARQLAEGLRARRLLGLSTDRGQVRALMSGTGDAGTTTWGIPMTLAEAALVDLPARAAFAERVDRVVFPVLERSASFGGAWMDQQHGGRLVVLLTRHDPPLARRIGALLGDGGPGYVIGRADRSYRDLLAAQTAIASRWVAAPTHAGIDSVGIDAAANALRVRVPADGSTALGVRGPLLATRPSVPLIVETRAAGRDLACTRRDACTPIRPGIVIRRGGRRSADGCTMGFLITDRRGAALLTSGHCGHVFGTHHRS